LGARLQLLATVAQLSQGIQDVDPAFGKLDAGQLIRQRVQCLDNRTEGVVGAHLVHCVVGTADTEPDRLVVRIAATFHGLQVRRAGESPREFVPAHVIEGLQLGDAVLHLPHRRDRLVQALLVARDPLNDLHQLRVVGEHIDRGVDDLIDSIDILPDTVGQLR